MGQRGASPRRIHRQGEKGAGGTGRQERQTAGDHRKDDRRGLNKELRAVTLLGQGFVRDPARQVADVLAEARARVLGFVRYEVGEALPT